MRISKSIGIFCLSILMTIPASFRSNAQERRIPVVPFPQEVVPGEGDFLPTGNTLSVRISGIEGKTKDIITGQLSESFDSRYGTELIFGGDKKPHIWIGIPARDKELAGLVVKKRIEPGRELGEEGYILRIENRNIYVVATGEAGAFYGIQSLRQLLRGYPDPENLPSMTIHDWPDIPFRCVMDDISRGPVPNNEFIRQQIRRYAEMKINSMSFYIEHVVRTEKYPDFSPDNGGITIEEFRELSDYASGYHIELVGNFQSLGHFEKILSFPQYRHLGATDRMLDPLNPASMDFLSDIYTEMAPAFSSRFFTPNCDEAWDLSRGGLTGAAQSLGVAKIYADHVMRIDSVLVGLGKRTIIWGDIILEHPEILEMIPDHIIVGAWDYSPSESFSEFIDPVKNAGFDFTISPGVLNSNRMIPDFRMTTTNIRNFINEGYRKGALGVYCTVWDDGGMHFFSRDWYGVAYNAEQSWRPNTDPLEDFDDRFSRGIYGDQKNIIPTALHTLNDLTDLGPTYEMNSNVLWKTLVPERGESVTFDPDSWKEVESIAKKAGDLLNGASTAAYDIDLAYLKFTCSQYIYLAESRNELLRAAGAYKRACAMQKINRIAALEQLNLARDIISKRKYLFERMMTDFEILWDMENREYWRDRGLMNYYQRIRSFGDQLKLLDQAIDNFKTGGYLPPPAEVRMEINKSTGQFFQYWLLAGSFPIASFEESARDFLEPLGGEAEAMPFPGMRFTDAAGKEWTWIKYDSPNMVAVDLKSIFEPHITAVAYAYCTIDSPEKQKVTALLGSNDGATVYCNGKKVHEIHAKRSLIPDEDEIVLELESGRNHIMVKVEQWKADWGFSFRLKGVDVRNHKQKYYIQ